MKSFTDIEQSKKLAEILPIESADMWWAERYEGHTTMDFQYVIEETPYYYLSLKKPSIDNYSQDVINDIPCWSLAALLNILDYPQLSKDKIGDGKFRADPYRHGQRHDEKHRGPHAHADDHLVGVLHVCDIRGQPRHQTRRAVLVDVGKGKALDALIHAVSQV